VQIDTIKKHFIAIPRDQKSRTHMTEVSIPTEETKSQVSDSSISLDPKGHCSAIDSQENNQDESMARNSASSKLPEAEVIIPTSNHLVTTSDNKFHLYFTR